jgi:hypothetical protein
MPQTKQVNEFLGAFSMFPSLGLDNNLALQYTCPLRTHRRIRFAATTPHIETMQYLAPTHAASQAL